MKTAVAVLGALAISGTIVAIARAVPPPVPPRQGLVPATLPTYTPIAVGPLSTLSFAIVGDSNPAVANDTAGYPTSIVAKIWQDIQNATPRPAFAIATGDYINAIPGGPQVTPQFTQWLSLRKGFSNPVYPVMGNHECNGYVTSNCGTGNADGVTSNYSSFVSQLLAPIGQTSPFYSVNVSGAGGAWSAKFVFTACNAWSSAQSAWLTSTLSKSTTYTFIVQHEDATAPTAPCVSASAAIVAQYPYTLLITGHQHIYMRNMSQKSLTVGNGGAPLESGTWYGYVIAQQQASGQMLFTAYEQSANTVMDTFTVSP
jgi:hypothetical protein